MSEICSCDVLMLTHDVTYYRQIDAMESPSSPMIANGWLSKFGQRIKGDAVLHGHYILRNINHRDGETKLKEINSYHSSLKFTIQSEMDQSLPFLDMKLLGEEQKLSSTWYTCLLYTSPSPRDATLSRMPSSA